MDDNLQNKQKQKIKIFLILFNILLFYAIQVPPLYGGVNPVGNALVQLVSFGLLIFIPLFFAKRFWHIIALFTLLVVPLAYF